jgi:hypothetical protein
MFHVGWSVLTYLQRRLTTTSSSNSCNNDLTNRPTFPTPKNIATKPTKNIAITTMFMNENCIVEFVAVVFAPANAALLLMMM